MSDGETGAPAGTGHSIAHLDKRQKQLRKQLNKHVAELRRIMRHADTPQDSGVLCAHTLAAALQEKLTALSDSLLEALEPDDIEEASDGWDEVVEEDLNVLDDEVCEEAEQELLSLQEAVPQRDEPSQSAQSIATDEALRPVKRNWQDVAREMQQMANVKRGRGQPVHFRR